MLITKNEYIKQIVIIGLISTFIGVGIGNNIGQEKPIAPIIKKEVKVKKIKDLTPTQARSLAASKLDDYGWSDDEFSCLNRMWGKESAWNYKAVGATNDHGIPQRHMSGNSKKEIHAFQSDPIKQINWGLGYIESRYGSPCKAWAFWERNHWY